MPHDTPLVATIVAGLVLAFVLGALANRFRVSPLVGYLLAGVAVGPYTPGFVADRALSLELAEIGVILLMFGVGLHFSLKDLMSVRWIALPGALAQIAFATVLGMALGHALGWTLLGGLVFGLALSVASTVVLLRALQERHLLDSERGRIAVGWLIVEDLAMVIALVLLPALAGRTGADGPAAGGLASLLGGPSLAATLAITLAKAAAFVALMLIVGRRIIPWILHYVAHTGSRELFRLAVLAIALGVAFGAAQLFGVSFALGAFFAGMVLSESELSHEAAAETLPLRDAFAVLFFVSVGMLFDPAILLRDPWPVLATVAIILVGKSLAALAIVLMFRHALGTALMIAASLAQIGEFSFILAGLGVGLDVLPERGRDLILAGAILSILANPLFFVVLDRLRPWLERRGGAADAVAQPAAPAGPPVPLDLADHAVIVGYGRVGRLVGEALARAGRPVLVIEDKSELAGELRGQGIAVVSGNAAAPEVLAAASLARARLLVVAIPNCFEGGQIVEQARAINPALDIVARAHFDAEVEHLRGLGAGVVVMGEREIARAMIEHALGRPAPA
ncbi:MAG: Kef family K(+) transporter [Alphaproteobacteria bacterium]|nr:Kef family K(+) transporter [Alphaproteobacteria bacterium]